MSRRGDTNTAAWCLLMSLLRFQGYYRLGKVFETEHKYEEAYVNYCLCRALQKDEPGQETRLDAALARVMTSLWPVACSEAVSPAHLRLILTRFVQEIGRVTGNGSM